MTKLDLGNANNDKIEEMNLIPLRSYACQKVRNNADWYLSCVDCPGGCKVGTRVKDILDGETKPSVTQTEKFNARMNKTLEARFQEAMKHPNPKQWLVDSGYYSTLESADTQIRKWKRKKKYGDHWDGPPAHEIQRERAMKTVEKIFEGADTVEEASIRFLQNQRPDIVIRNVFGKAYDWCKKYPEMLEKYPVMNKVGKFINKKEYHNLTAAEVLAMITGNKPEENDEVSVEDYLKELEETASVEETENIPEETKSEFVETQNSNVIQDDSLVLRREFGRKKQELRSRLNDIRKRIAELSEQEKAISHQIVLLDGAAELFNMRPTA